MSLLNTEHYVNYARQPKEVQPAEGCEAPARILIVEDEDSLAEILTFNLKRNGFEVLTATDGLDACRMIGLNKPDLILLDIMLPQLSGWEICRMLRSHLDDDIRQTPVIMLSALYSEKDKLKGYALGADLYLAKPYSVKEVMLQTRRLIEQRQHNRLLNRQLTSLRQWTELQDNWQHALFHELRNQLTVISGMADHIHENGSDTAEHTGEFIEHISASSHYLGDLAEHYLLVRKVEDEDRALLPERFHLAGLVEELLQVFAPLARQKSCQFKTICPADLYVNLHPVGLKIVLASLLENALKYTFLDGHVELEVADSESGIEISICDDGPGIAAEEQDKIFDKFYRGQQQQERSNGSGLGLYMARTLVQAMGGKLELATQHPQLEGCCFILSFAK